jgi:hypothetical protein
MSQEVDDMTSDGRVTQAADELCSQLEAQSIPDDFDAAGDKPGRDDAPDRETGEGKPARGMGAAVIGE